MRFDLHRAWARLVFTEPVRLRVYRQIATMLANGLPLVRVLDDLYQRASLRGRRPSEPLAIVLFEWKRAVQSGRMLSDGMSDWAPRAERLLVQAGEQSGRLEASLAAAAEVVQTSRRIRSAVIGGAAYPILILCSIVGYIYLFGTRVVPEFARLGDPAQWHGAARGLHWMSLWVQQWMPLAVLALLAAFGLVAYALPRWSGSSRLWVERVPPFSIYRLISGSSFLLAFSALLAAGITVEKALYRQCESAGPWLRERLEGALLGVKSGLNCGEALRHAGYGFPSAEIVDDLCVYSEYRGFPEVLQRLAHEWMEDGVARISAQMKLANGLAIALLTTVIAWLAVGMFSIQEQVVSSTRLMH
ncbi:Type II secretory pathway, component PulF [Roseateles sp. YR242]|uniref:type II secretion system F family protein n=1 Tax=Roseateles sp. YR242 TaxID=1855305 RepID=UPI0008B14F92|nr:type II secretion system F family protein [Roseateles sp. YR242]SEK64501.1 Type II secretory pathway, component PulF [Roseateles sp. YR242]